MAQRRGHKSLVHRGTFEVIAMSATTTNPAENDAAHDGIAHSPTEEAPRRASRPGASADDWVTAAVVFGILGGCIALWLADLSLVTGMVAAVFSGLIGVLFADI